MVHLLMRQLICLCVIGVPTLVACQANLSAAPPSGQEVDADRALRSIGNPPWYDKQEDRYAPPTIRKSPDNPLRSDGWIAVEVNNKKKERAKQNQGGGGGGGWTFSGLDANLFTVLILVMLGVLLLALIGLLLFHSLRDYMPGRQQTTLATTAIKIDPTRVSDLPFEVAQATYDNPLAEAEALMKAGDLNQAMVLLYGYMLLALDQARKIDLQRGKTNRMYLSELKSIPELRRIVTAAMLGFEDVYFGKHSIARDRFQDIWSSLPAFHQLATANPAVASPAGLPGVAPA